MDEKFFQEACEKLTDFKHWSERECWREVSDFFFTQPPNNITVRQRVISCTDTLQQICTSRIHKENILQFTFHVRPSFGLKLTLSKETSIREVPCLVMPTLVRLKQNCNFTFENLLFEFNCVWSAPSKCQAQTNKRTQVATYEIELEVNEGEGEGEGEGKDKSENESKDGILLQGSVSAVNCLRQLFPPDVGEPILYNHFEF